MPAKSQAQQKAAGAALSAKRGETKKGALNGASKQMYDSMSEKQLEEFAETDRNVALAAKKRLLCRAGWVEVRSGCWSSRMRSVHMD